MTGRYRNAAFGAALLAAALWPASVGALDLNVGGLSVTIGVDNGVDISATVSAGQATATPDLGASVEVGASSAGGIAVGAAATVGDEATSAGVAIGGAHGIADVSVEALGASAEVGVDEGGSLRAGVNLGLGGPVGGLLDDPPIDPPDFGLDDGGINGWRGEGAGPGEADIVRVFARFDPREQQLLVSRCISILSTPSSYDLGLVDLCLALARLNGPLIR